MTYRFMKQQEGHFEVQIMGQTLGVSRSGYYAWRRRGETTHHEQQTARLVNDIQKIFADSHQTYGSPRVYAQLKSQSIRCSRHRVARLMHQAGLSAALPRRRVNTTQRDGRTHSACNIRNGWWTLQRYGLMRAGYTWQGCWICSHDALWAGLWMNTCLTNSLKLH
jgi:putative transposase